jgi:methylglyoxal synthase
MRRLRIILIAHDGPHGAHVAARPPWRRRAAGALIASGEADVLVFFWEPLEVQPHDVDVKALLRLAVLRNVPTACNRATADYLISSPLFGA